jgi:hypothetical protein
LPYVRKTDEELLDCLNENFEKKRKQVQDAVLDYLMWFETCPKSIEDKETGLLKMEWNSEKDNLIAKEYIKDLGKLLSSLRGHVEIWSSKNTQHEYLEYAYSFTQTEDPARAVTQLYNLARGHALLLGRNHITIEDIPIAVKVALSTASIERVAVMDLLLSKKGRLTLSKIAKALTMSKSTALKTMTEFAALKLVDMKDVEAEYNMTKEITLKPEFRWLLSEEFNNLRDGFTPVDNSDYDNETIEDGK